MSHLVLKRATASRPSCQWNDDDFDVLADGTVVGRIFLSAGAPQDRLGTSTIVVEGGLHDAAAC
jgi:hypothetical protein